MGSRATTDEALRERPVRAGDVYQVACADLLVLSLEGDEHAVVVNSVGGGELLATCASLLQGRLVGWGQR